MKLTKYPIHITVGKTVKKLVSGLRVPVESLKASIFSTYVSDKQLSKALTTSYTKGGGLLENLRENLHRSFFPHMSDRKDIVHIMESQYPHAIKQTIDAADKVCEHVFNILGSGDVYLAEEINWHRDCKTGWEWKTKYYKNVKCRQLDKPYDVKVPWELSRCQHFVTLGKAYWYTEDEKYAREFVTEIDNWIEANPPKLGVNWVCTMEVAIRAVNWVWGICFFMDSPSITEDFAVRFLKGILAHARHIESNLEKHTATSNHYLSNLVGLVYIGVVFPEFGEAKRWREYGIKELIREMDKQVYPDGVDYEASTCYHRLVTELFLSSTLLCLNNRSMFRDCCESQQPNSRWFPFPDWYMQRLEKMIQFVMYYSNPQGIAVQIGDNDDGRLHILSDYGNRNELDHTYLLSVGAILFRNSAFKASAGKLHEEALWLFGVGGVQEFSAIANSNVKVLSRGFADSGIYVMRDSDTHAVVDCIPHNPAAPTSHLHNSRLSFELYMSGRSVIRDPGTFVYTEDATWRHLFRSTGYHNTIMIDAREQNSIQSSCPFTVRRKGTVKVNCWEITHERDLLDVEHSCYSDISVIHRRRFILDKVNRSYIVEDSLLGSGSHKIEAFFHLAPSVKPYFDEVMPTVVIGRIPDAHFALIPFPLHLFEVSVKESWFSRRYGTRVPSIIVRYAKTKQIPIKFSFFICPLSSISDRELGEEIEHLRDQYSVRMDR